MQIVYKLLKPYILKNKIPFIFGILCLILVDIFQLAIPLFIAKSIDLIQSGLPFKDIQLYLCLIGVTTIIMGFLRYGWRMWIIGTSRLIEKNLRDDFFYHVEHLSLSQIRKHNTGDIVSISYNDIGAIRRMIGSGIMSICDSIVILIVAFGLMFYLSFSLSLKILLPLPLLSVFMAIIGSYLNQYHHALQDEFSLLTSQSQEDISAIRVIKSFCLEKLKIKKASELSQQYLICQLKLAFIEGLFFPIVRFISKLSLAILIYFGGKMVIAGQITLGTFTAFAEYINLLFWPLLAVGYILNIYQKGKAGCHRLFEILKHSTEEKKEWIWNSEFKPNLFQDNKTKKLEPKCIEFKNFTFFYPQNSHFKLKDISFSIEPGKTLGIIGPVGSGKTTLIQALLRLYPIPKNTIFYGGEDILNIPIYHWRKNFGYVHQEPFIFSNTIENNVTLGKKEVSSFWSTLQNASFKDEVSNFSNHQNTLVGEWGITLSGGQRQRLALSRILFDEHPIYILDDSLSNIDIKTEDHILKNIHKHTQNSTCIMITHRLSCIDLFDTIVFLQDGMVTDIGAHDDLLNRNDDYRKMVEHQLLENKLLIEAKTL